ncbi:MAG: TlpA disulfide reductase family protein [Vicinamibacterales bacterium]
MIRLFSALLLACAPLFALSAQTPPLPKVGGPAPEFAFSAVVQGTSALAGLRPKALTGRVVVLDFFATWCVPCVAAIPRTNALIAEFENDPVTFLAVANETRAVLDPFLAAHPIRATLVLDDADKTYGNYLIRSLPFIVIIDPTGRISAFASPETLSAEQIRSALKR